MDYLLDISQHYTQHIIATIVVRALSQCLECYIVNPQPRARTIASQLLQTHCHAGSKASGGIWSDPPVYLVLQSMAWLRNAIYEGINIDKDIYIT
jgi:hypothetical protein